MIALRSINFTGGGADPEEEMYKELFIQLAADTLPSTVVIPKAKLEFVGTDGSLTWDGSAWVKS